MSQKSVDYPLFFTVLLMIIFGMIMISSVSVWWSFRVTSAQAAAWYISEAYNHFYVIRNIIHVLVSLCLLWVLVKVKYSVYEKYSKHIFWLAIVLLIVVLILWEAYKWARWWIAIPWIPFNIQPTEFLKFALIVYLAAFFKQYKQYLQSFSQWFIPFSLVILSILILVWAQPDFWTILVVIPLSFIMFFYAWANIKHLWLMFIVWVSIAGWVYLAGDYDPETGKNLNSLWYITNRIDNFLADNQEAIANKTINYQTEQALVAIGSWWFNWLWFWGSVQKFWYLPEVQWDFIFSVIVEELGFIGAFILVNMYLYIGYRGVLIARYSKDLFAKYAAIWVTTWILLQAFINIWVNLNIVPLTGITLPFISYWWSSLLSLSFGLALLLSISRDRDPENYKKKMRRKKYFSIKKSLWL